MSVAEKEFPDIVGARPDVPASAEFEPYIPSAVEMREFTALPIIIGTILGVVFGAASLYLVLKVGLTVSASIPVAVLSITFFRILSKMGGRDATILENNVVQTAGSAGESIAFGVGVTMPAILILGFDLEITRVMLVAVLGGLLGILMMIPLRRALIVAQHGTLKYPEGTACAEVLKAGASEESIANASQSAKDEMAKLGGQATSAKTIFAGFGVGFLYKAMNVAFRWWKDTPERIFGPPFEAGSISAEISPELLGVGYIIGPRIASIMCAGGVLAYLVLIPAIKFFGAGLTTPLAPESTRLIKDMGPNGIRSAYVLYIGAGAVAAGGIVSMLRSLPTIWHGLQEGLKDMRGGSNTRATMARTDRDLPMKTVLIGSFALVAIIALATPLYHGGTGVMARVMAAILIVVLGFLFVTVSSRLTGEIGSSSNPISGMTVATLLITCLVFLVIGWTGPSYYVTALSIGAIVCIASSNGGTTSQDLKTGYLVGSTPKYQQIAILIGALASALALGPLLLMLNNNGSVYLPRISSEPTTGEEGSPLKQIENWPAGLHTDQATMATLSHRNYEGKDYFVWHYTPAGGASAQEYLVDSAGTAQFLVDPVINGTHKFLANGKPAPKKFDAPKATLMSYIIKGILNHKLPWGLVLLGVIISLTLEMSGIPSLAFAVGVYLPLSSSSPIFIGGMIRWLSDLYVRKKYRDLNLTEEQLTAEGDKSPGVLMASGYIAGGAIAGILIAFMAGLQDKVAWVTNFNASLDKFADKNPFASGANADLLSCIPFIVLVTMLYLVGREIILAGKAKET
ncbi:MAG TPA: oligopeptide transporter, OPT family [Thermoanaerobaculia bacterium]|nr:oligopeptide transporter, OPT family [Thermoanaerobaculia bacterium]